MTLDLSQELFGRPFQSLDDLFYFEIYYAYKMNFAALKTNWL
jgi:hypothetical protein